MSYSVNTADANAIYSVRWVNLSYTGPIFTIRRSSDSLSADFYTDQYGTAIGTAAGGTGQSLTSWLGGATTAFITTWYDQSTKGKHATQTILANQSRYDTTNNRVIFNGSSYFVMPNSTIPPGDGNYTMTIRHGSLTTSGISYFICAGDASNNPLNNNKVTTFHINNDSYNNAWGGSGLVFDKGSRQSNSIVTVKYDGARRYGYIGLNANGYVDLDAPIATLTNGVPHDCSSNNNYIGAGRISSNISRFLNGQLDCVYIYATAMDDTKRRSIETSIAYTGTASSPTIGTITPGLNSLTVNFTSPGSTNFYSFNSNGSSKVASVTSPFTINNISTLTTFYVINVSGNVDYISTAGTGTPNVAGNAPSNLSVSPVDGSETSLSVSFTGSSGGNPALTKYQYSLNGGAFQDATGTTSPITISGLTAGTSYTVVLKALSGTAWASGNSTVSSPVTTNKKGGAPSIASVTAVDGSETSLNVSFTESATIGIPTLTGYQYSVNGAGGPFLDANWTSGTTFVITLSSLGVSLSPNTSYVVLLRSKSGTAWTSDSSTASSPVTTNKKGNAPTNLSVSPVDGSETLLTVSFTGSSGGNPALTKYQYSLNSGEFLDAVGTSSPITISSLNAGTAYTVALKALSGTAWTSDSSTTSSSVTTNKKGSAPSILSVSPVDGSETSLSVSFTGSSGGNPALTKYQYSLNSGGFLDAVGTSSPITISSLNAGTAYTIRLKALSGTAWASDSSTTSSSVTTNKKGSAPVIGTITPGLNQLSVAFTQETQGTSPTTYYYSLDGTTKLGSGTTTSPLVISGISSLTTFYIIARNPGGDISSSSNASGTPYFTGGTPTSLSASPVNGSETSLSVSFTPSTTTGNPTLTQYQYSVNNGSSFLDATGTTSPITISGLTTGTPYTVILRSLSVLSGSTIWTSTNSIASSSVTTNRAGLAPSIINVVPINGSETELDVSFNISTNGIPNLTKYQYSLNGGAFQDAAGTTSPIRISTLSAGTSYTVALRALSVTSGNVVWTSASSSSAPVVTNKVGGIPANLVATPVDGSENALDVSFAESTGGVPTLTKYQYSLNGGSFQDAVGTTSPIRITGLTAGTPYIVRLKALSGSVWTSSNSTESSSVTTNKKGSAPTINKITGAANSLIVDFTGSTGGSPSPSTYYYSLDGGNYVDAKTANSPLTIKRLTTVGPYLVKIYAVNAAGNSPASNEVSGTPIIGSDAQITPATYWTQSASFFVKSSFWKKSYWSKRKR